MSACLPIVDYAALAHESLLSPSNWRTPSLSQLDLFPEPLEDPPASATIPLLPQLESMPIEVLEEIALSCLRFRDRTARSTLLALSLTNSELTQPAQRALLRSVSLSTSMAIRSLAKTLQAEPGLGLSCRSLRLRIAPPVIYISSARKATAMECQDAQIQELTSLLPFLPQVKQVTLNCDYNLPERILALLVQHCKLIKRCSVSSAAGYAKLVYVSPKAACMLMNWPSLTDISLTMPLISSSDPELFDTAMMQALEPSAFRSDGLKSLSISGFRGQPSNLRSVIALAGSHETVERFSFVCPLDEEDGSEIGDCLATSFAPGQLKHLSLWSWSGSYRSQIVDVLRRSDTLTNLRSLACSANDLDEELIAALPSTLTRILICTHTAYSPLLKIEETVQALLHRGRKGLKEVVLYDPGADSCEGAGIAWEPLMRSSIRVMVSSHAEMLYG